MIRFIAYEALNTNYKFIHELSRSHVSGGVFICIEETGNDDLS